MHLCICLLAIAEQFCFVPLCLFVLKNVPNGELFALIYHKQHNGQQKEERNVKKKKKTNIVLNTNQIRKHKKRHKLMSVCFLSAVHGGKGAFKLHWI